MFSPVNLWLASIDFAPGLKSLARTGTMPHWVLICQECKVEFNYSDIDASVQPTSFDPFAWIGDKPEMRMSGVAFECPNCKNISVYKRHHLIYRRDEAASKPKH
jgi:hypothetical protein